MKHEEALKLMELMINHGYSKEYIMWTLINCETGMGIGHSISAACILIYKENEEYEKSHISIKISD